MAITAKLVKELRDRTGAGMMDCKKALKETDGDLAAAVEYLQIKGIAKAAKKADRVAAEGLVGTHVSADGKTAALLEVNCETDFVARNEDFAGFVSMMTAHVAATGVSDIDALLESELDGQKVDEIRKARISTTGENISLRRAAVVNVDGEGVIGAYVHGGGNIGVLVQLSASAAVDATGAAADVARDLAMHVAAINPRFVRDSDVDPETVENEKRVLTEQALESGKPREIVEKMIVGRLKKWKKEICLLDQPFVKNGDVTVAQELKRVGGELGVELDVVAFTRFVRGEGIEKQETNLAEEVAALSK